MHFWEKEACLLLGKSSLEGAGAWTEYLLGGDTHGRSVAKMRKDEKLVCIITFGYGDKSAEIYFMHGKNGVFAWVSRGFCTKIDLDILQYHFESKKLMEDMTDVNDSFIS